MEYVSTYSWTGAEAHLATCCCEPAAEILSSFCLQLLGAPSSSVLATLTSWASGTLWTCPNSWPDTALMDQCLAVQLSIILTVTRVSGEDLAQI